MKKLMVVLLAVVLGFAFLSSPSISEARGGVGAYYGGYRGGSYGGYHGGYYGGYRGGYYGGYYGGYPGYYGGGYYPGYFPYYWGYPIVGWPYAYYGGWPYAGSPYYYPPEGTGGAPSYNVPEQQQPYYWYYCKDLQGYYPYVKSCPGGWIEVEPKPPRQ